MDHTASSALEQLKRIHAVQERSERKLEQVIHRLENLEARPGLIIQHLGHLASAGARHQLAADGFDRRLERIERRLALV